MRTTKEHDKTHNHFDLHNPSRVPIKPKSKETQRGKVPPRIQSNANRENKGYVQQDLV